MDGPFVQVISESFPSRRSSAPIAFLDRDGVLNVGRQGYVNAPNEVELLPHVAESVAELKKHGFMVCVVTNQSPLSRGLWGPDQLQAIHESLVLQLQMANNDATLDLILTCPHMHHEGCACRKPSPAMLNLGSRLIRESMPPELGFEPSVLSVDRSVVDWWGEKPTPPHPLDLMVGDRRSDMGAGWAYGARLYRVSQEGGLADVANRITDNDDAGDRFLP